MRTKLRSVLNGRQKAAILIGLVAAGFVALYPPWVFDRRMPGTGTRGPYILRTVGPWSTPWGSNGNLFDPPQWEAIVPPGSAFGMMVSGSRRLPVTTAIDFERLGMAWCMIAVVVVVIVIKARNRPSDISDSPSPD